MADEIASSGIRELQITKILPVLRDTFDLLKRTSYIILNIVNQLHTLYYKKDRFYKNVFKNFQLFSPIETLGRACGLIYLIDLIVLENLSLREDFNKFKNLLRSVAKEPARFDVNEQQLRKLERSLNKFERTILCGACFQGTITQTFDQKPDPNFTSLASEKPIKDNVELYELFTEYYKKALETAEVAGSPTETFERKFTYEMCCGYALYRKLFPGEEDSTLWKKIWYLQKKTPIIVLYSHIVFSISNFMSTLGALSRKPMIKDPKDPESYVMDFIEKKGDSFEKEMTGYNDQFCAWATQMDSTFGRASSLKDEKKYEQMFHLKNRLLMSGYSWINSV